MSHLRYFFLPVLVSILKSLAASPLASTATFSAVHFSMSEAEYSSLVASSASPAQVVIEISTDPIDFTYFSVFSADSVSSTVTRLVSLTFTVSSVVLPTSIAALAVTFLFLLLSLLGLYIGVGWHQYLLNIFHTYHNLNEYFLTLYLSSFLKSTFYPFWSSAPGSPCMHVFFTSRVTLWNLMEW